jgi:hypothetical protein
MPNPEKLAADTKREHASAKRLRDRVETSLEAGLAETTLFRSRPEMGKAEVYVHSFFQFLQVTIQISNDKLRLLAVDGRADVLRRFASEVDVVVTKVAADNRLEIDPIEYGPIADGTAAQHPIGWHAKLNRSGR